MADDETASGLPVLSAFDQLKLSSSNNNFMINRNTSCSNVNLSNRTQIDKNSHSNSVVDVTTSIAASVSAVLATSAVATENQKCEKSISLPLAQFECNNKKPIVMFGSSEINTTYTSSSACEKRCASGYSSLPPPLSSSTIPSTKSEKTIQIICGASDMNGAALSFTPSLSVTSSSSSISSSSSPPLLTPLSSSSISPSPSLATITMVLPNNSLNTGNFDMFSTPSPLLSSSSLTVQNKMKKFDTNEVSIKMLKSGKCKSSVSVSSTTPVVAAQAPPLPPTMRQLKPLASKSAAIICAPPPMVLPIQSNKFANSSASNKKSNPKGKNQNFGFPMLPGTVPSATAAAKQQSTNVDNNKKRQSSTTEKTEHATTDDRNKKKRCSDRYDSSESSDSGVATSLSCTDSSTASSDVSDPGSPYSPVLLGDDLQHKPIMPPQTILATTNGNAAKSPTTGAATPVQNVLKGGKQQQKHQNQSEHKGITPQQPRKNGKAQISSQKVTHHIWPWTSLHAIEDIAKPTCNNKTANNKRHSQVSSTPTDGGAKKTRTTNSNIIDSSAALPPLHIAQNGKRLKAAAMEESQTKITGYFKSQMKAQIHQSGLKKDTMAHILPSTSSPSITVTAVPSTSSSSLTSSSSPLCNVTTASSNCSQMNSYFNLLTSQLKKEQERTASTVPVMPMLPQPLKKIERSKPTKIAQVAPNLRKTTAAPQLSAQAMEKSPPKKHVPIAPRTVDTRPKHELALSSPIKPPQHQPQLQQQPSVLLTAIRIPQPNQPPHLVPTSPQIANGSCPKPPQQNGAPAAATCPSKVSTGPSLYQIPMMPNLVQFPNLLATNVSQLTGARGNHSHHHPTAQYLFNGTVFKLQQFSGPPTGNNPPTFSIENGNQSVNTATVNTTATAIEHASNNKNTSSITATNLQEMLSNQFQTQQQQQQQQQSVAAAHNHRMHHSQQVFMATTTGLLLNAASLPSMLGNKQAMSIQPQQIPALQPIQGASAMMPGLSSIFSSHQEVSAQQLHQYKSEQVAFSDTHTPPPPLQPTTQIPPLSVSSSAFSKLTLVNAAGAFTPSVHQVSATQPPPLVTISSGSQNVTVSTKATSNKPSVNNKPYQKKSAKQESTVKSKNNAEYSKNSLPPLVTPISALALPAPAKSPPALAYPSLIIPKDMQTRSEDLFDLIKNSKNETTIAPLSMLYTPAEKLTEEPISTTYVQPPSPAPTSVEIEDPLSSSSIPSSAPASPETLSNSTTIAKLVNSPDSSCSLETSLASSSLISAESPKLLIDLKPDQETETTTALSISEKSPSTDSFLSTLTPVDTALADSDTLPKSAISPILSQPKTIRFPPNGCRFGPKGMRRHDGVCYWDKCNKKHESSSKLLDHMQTHHVNSQTGPFACLWLGCKVYGRESCSRRWLERHVLSHGGTKPFKCIVDGCGLRFGSQLALQKHVNGHFTATENKDSTNKRTSDPPVPKLLRKNGKKLRYRRQPFSARMFDFFDTGIMEGLNHRLRQISTLTNGNNSITFQGEIIMRRKTKGIVECYVQWSPPKIISNEWLPESCMPYVKTLPINRMQPNEKTNVESLLNSAYRLPYSPNLFQSFHSLSRQNSHDSNTSLQDNSQSTATTSTTPTTATTTTADENSRGSSIDNPSLSSISKLPLKLPQMELRQKQSRKPPKRIQPS